MQALLDRTAIVEALARLRDQDGRSIEDAIEILRKALGLDEDFEWIGEASP